MRLLLDINVLLDIAFKRPGEGASAALIAACGRQYQGYLAWHTVATLAYLIERQDSATMARDFIRGVLTWAEISPTTRADAVNALAWPMKDFEDALQAAAAVACGASWVITRNERDFTASSVPALTPEEFLARYPAA